MRGWRRRRNWPPPPCVESEEESLAHEVRDSPTIDTKSDDEAQSRGTIDQYPLILDVDLPECKSKSHDIPFDQSSIASQSSDESTGPPTPLSEPSSLPRQRSPLHKQTIRRAESPKRQTDEHSRLEKLEEERKPRGRFGLSPIDTQVDGDIRNMLTGQRRAPSPYRMVKPEKEDLQTPSGRFSGEFLLSPQQASLGNGRPGLDERRMTSTQPPREQRADLSSSDDSDRRRQNHRRRPTRGGSRPAVVHQEVRPISRTSSYSYADNGSFMKAAKDGLQRSRHEEYSDSERRSATTHSAYASSAEESRASVNTRSRTNGHRQSTTASSFTNSPKSRTNGSDSWISGGSSDEGRRRRKDEFSDTERRRSRMSSSFVYGDEYKPRNWDRNPASNSASSHDVSLKSKRHSTLELPLDSSNRRRDHSRTRDRSSTRSSRPSSSNVSRPTIDTLLAGASMVSSPVSEQYLDQGRPRLESEMSRRDYGVDRHGHRSSATTPTTAVPSSQIWDRGLSDNESRHRNSGSSTRTSPRGTPLEQTHISKAPGDYFSVGSGISSQTILPKVRTASQGGIADDTRTTARTNLKRPPAMPHSPRSSSDIPKVSHFTRPELRQRVASTVPPIIEQRTRPPSVSAAASPMGSPRTVQRAFSYSPTDDFRRVDYGPYREKNVLIVPSTQRQRPIHSAPPSRDQVPRQSDFQISLSNLPDCPNSHPSTGHRDWYTIFGIESLHFCPTCTRVIDASPFRKQLIAQSSGASEPVSCSMSQPWIRLGWIQTIKQRVPNLSILKEIVEESIDTKPCPGRKSDVRRWFSLYDPATDKMSNNFDVCSACVRSIRAIFPNCHDVFVRNSNVAQERYCDLDCHSKRFNQYMGLLEDISKKYDPKRHKRPPTQDLIEYVNKTTSVIECPGSTPMPNKLWHFIPELPELTICPECYYAVVWPVKDRPIANLVTRTMELVPGTSRHDLISCQLYSERSRRNFREAVQKENFKFLEERVKDRYRAVKLLSEKLAIVAKDIEQNIDRQAELEHLERMWKAFE